MKRITLAALALVLVLPAIVAAVPEYPDASPGEPPADYIAAKDTLSQPVYGQTVTESHRVPLHDGEEMYVEITRPDPAVHGDGPWPVVMEVSPYHGTIADRQGIRIFPDPTDAEGNRLGLTGYFAPRGYAVAIADLRGTGKSSGCLDHLGQNDAQDLKSVVEWAAAQPWSAGKVGLTGHSYVGSTPSIAAAQAPEGLVTIAPSAGLASMYDHQFHSGVPYWLQWAGPQWAYEELAMGADMPPAPVNDPYGGYEWGDNWENHQSNPDETGCGWQNSAFTAGHGQVTGQYQGWHAERDHGEAAAKADLPIFMIHGVNDNAARIPAAEWFFGDRVPRPGDKVWIGQWDHGSSGGNTSCDDADPAVGHVNCRFEQWQYALHAWFDKHLQGRDVDTGPPVEAFLNDDEVITLDHWDGDGTTEPLRLYADATDMSLGAAPPEGDGSASFESVVGDNAAEFVSDSFTEDTTLLGLPNLKLTVSQSSPTPLHVVTTLSREDKFGNRHPVNFCAGNTGLRESVDSPSVIVPETPMELNLQCFTSTHHVEAGEHLVLEVGTTSEHHAPFLATDPHITVHTGPDASLYELPALADQPRYPDVTRFEEPDLPDA